MKVVPTSNLKNVLVEENEPNKVNDFNKIWETAESVGGDSDQ